MRRHKAKLFIQLKNSRAFSLLEMLVALALFTFLFLFITQIVRQNHRQAAKIKKDLELTDSIYHVVNLIKEDLSSVTYFLDLSYNFRTHFPLAAKEGSEGLSQNLNLTAGASIAQTSNSPFKNSVLLDNEVIFKGGSQEMEFVSYSFSKNTNFKQWMKIRYAVEDCPADRAPGDCLMRYEKLDWNRDLPDSEAWEEPALVVREGLESLQLLYSDDYSLIDPEWGKNGSRRHRVFKLLRNRLFRTMVLSLWHPNGRRSFLFRLVFKSFLKRKTLLMNSGFFLFLKFA